MGRRGRAVAAVLLVASAALGVAGAPGAVAAPTDGGGGRQAAAWLPQPTGPYPIGTTSLHLTDAGRDLVRHHLPVHLRREEELLSPLNVTERQQLEHLLRRLIVHAETQQA